jgi:hypothetical protein
LSALGAALRFGLEIVDVDSDPDLVRRYGKRVPVLVCDGREFCHYHLDTVVITAL